MRIHVVTLSHPYTSGTVDPVPPVPAGNASHAALHRSAPRGLPRLTSGGALDHREASVSVVSRSLFRDQARKRPRPGNSPARRTTKAGGSLAFPEERKPRAQRPVLGAMAGCRSAVLFMHRTGEQQRLSECTELHPGPEQLFYISCPDHWTPDIYQ